MQRSELKIKSKLDWIGDEVMNIYHLSNNILKESSINLKCFSLCVEFNKFGHNEILELCFAVSETTKELKRSLNIKQVYVFKLPFVECSKLNFCFELDNELGVVVFCWQKLSYLRDSVHLINCSVEL